MLQKESLQPQAVCCRQTDSDCSRSIHHYGRHKHTLRYYQAEDTHTGQHQGEEEYLHREHYNTRVDFLHSSRCSYHHRQSVRQQVLCCCSASSGYDPTKLHNHPSGDRQTGWNHQQVQDRCGSEWRWEVPQINKCIIGSSMSVVMVLVPVSQLPQCLYAWFFLLFQDIL